MSDSFCDPDGDELGGSTYTRVADQRLGHHRTVLTVPTTQTGGSR